MRVLEIVQALAEAVERGDEGDMDSPAWENDYRMLRLYTELRLLAASAAIEGRDEGVSQSRAIDIVRFGGVPAA
jgi:hypothetical protein